MSTPRRAAEPYLVVLWWLLAGLLGVLALEGLAAIPWALGVI